MLSGPPRRLHIVADLGLSIGTGHVMRQLALATAWTRYEGSVTLSVPSEPSPALAERISSAGVELRPSPPAECDWIVADSYRIDAERQRSLRVHGRLAVFDDHARLDEHFGEIVIDQNLGAERSMYAFVDEALCGPRFALLRSEFSTPDLQTVARSRRFETVGQVLVTLGGDPPPQLLDRVIDTVRTAFPAARVEVAGGGRNDMAQLMASCDVAVTAAGSTVWELCQLGVPMGAMAIADNQEPVVRALAGAGVALDGADLDSALNAIAHDGELRRRLSTTAQVLVDGRGAQRVVAALRSRCLSVRAATMSDAALLLDWANDEQTRIASFNSAPIALEGHLRWLGATLADPDRCLVVISDGERPIGQLRLDVDRRDAVAVVGVSLDRSMRGNGMGPAVIRAGVRHARRALGWVGPIDAWIKSDNVGSARSFDLAGFIPAGRGEQARQPALRYREVGDV